MKRLSFFLTSLIACLLIGISSACAKDEVNFGEIELGKTYNLKDDGYFYGTFTAKEDGYLHVYSSATSTIRPFKEWKGTSKATMAAENNAYGILQIRLKDNFAFNYELHVQTGKTYYFCNSLLKGDDVNITFEMGEKTVEYFKASVEEGETVSPTTTSAISFSFNRPVVAASAAIIYGDGKEESVSSYSSSYNCSVSANIKDALVRLANAEQIKEGDEFTVVMKNVKEDPDDITDGSEPIKYGDVSVKVKLGALPAMLQSITLDGAPVNSNTKFLTYYAPGTGIMVLTFTKKLKDTANATLRFGDLDQSDNGGYYMEQNDAAEGNFTLTTKDNQIILDFSGKRRAVNDMVSSTESNREVDFTKISLEISNVRDSKNVKAYTTSSTTMGRFNYTISLDVPEANVSSDFTPANGSSLKNVDEIEIWITDEASLTYEGIRFSYEDENGAVQDSVVTDFTKEIDEEEEGAVYLTVKVPEVMKTTNNVVVSLHNVTCVDGKNYSNVIAAKYNVVETGINGVNANFKSAKLYNLNGQAIQENYLNGKGIIITNGKKMMSK